ncbi:hypothetical protein Cri9333_0454 [Crinalium epipsammum PCC 9333]|uniref:Cytochrome b561 bacterial/Ni-hydrogenase domain-containing protein n=1 Tax=Crinalium epipsammum PCC 9333 TaxID=1173022 RepID=K9VV96_9CYAN|nr:hypothetical protein Cri9333_0454 [Crinalium epipsammum PCC 9333]
MKSTQPYQPLLLRILHGFTGLFLVAAILTAFWTYDTYDGRWGRIPLPTYRDIEGVHGTFGLYTLLIFPFFVLYAFHRGQRRLIQPDSLAKLSSFGKPIWWYTLNRFTNTFALIALTFAVFSGKMMDETWLPKGELNHAWYYAHLIAWVIMAIAIALHLNLECQSWWSSITAIYAQLALSETKIALLCGLPISLLWWSSLLQGSRENWFQSPQILVWLESAILFTVIAAWIIPLFK